MKILNNTIKNPIVQDDFEKKIESIEKKIFNYLEPTHKKIYHDDLNTLSYNQRDIVRKSWEDSLEKRAQEEKLQKKQPKQPELDLINE